MSDYNTAVQQFMSIQCPFQASGKILLNYYDDFDSASETHTVSHHHTTMHQICRTLLIFAPPVRFESHVMSHQSKCLHETNKHFQCVGVLLPYKKSSAMCVIVCGRTHVNKNFIFTRSLFAKTVQITCATFSHIHHWDAVWTGHTHRWVVKQNFCSHELWPHNFF